MRKRLKLLIDTREGLPLDEFKEGIFDEIIREGLPCADYWGAVSEDGGEWKQFPLSFERKGKPDLWQTFATKEGHRRFRTMLEKADKAGMKVILLIEGTMMEIFEGIKQSQFTGDSMLKLLATMRIRHDLEYHFCESRRAMCRLIEDWFKALAKEWSTNKEPHSPLPNHEASSDAV